MGWQLIVPERKAQRAADCATIVLRVMADGGVSAKLFLAKGLVERLGAAWGGGSRLEVSLGNGADHGKLRLQLSEVGDHLLSIGNGATTRPVSLGRHAAWARDRGKWRIQPADLALEDDVMTITLPPEVLTEQARRSEP